MSDKGVGSCVRPLLKHLQEYLYLCLPPSSYHFGMCIVFLFFLESFACCDVNVQPFYRHYCPVKVPHLSDKFTSSNPAEDRLEHNNILWGCFLQDPVMCRPQLVPTWCVRSQEV